MAPYPAERHSWVPVTYREREIQRQIGRLVIAFPEARAMMLRMLDMCNPAVQHGYDEREEAEELASLLTMLLQALSAVCGDARPALTITCGGKPCDRRQ